MEGWSGRGARTLPVTNVITPRIVILGQEKKLADSNKARRTKFYTGKFGFSWEWEQGRAWARLCEAEKLCRKKQNHQWGFMRWKNMQMSDKEDILIVKVRRRCFVIHQTILNIFQNQYFFSFTYLFFSIFIHLLFSFHPCSHLIPKWEKSCFLNWTELNWNNPIQHNMLQACTETPQLACAPSHSYYAQNNGVIWGGDASVGLHHLQFGLYSEPGSTHMWG